MYDLLIKLFIAIAGAGGAAVIKNYVVPLYIERFKEPTQLRPNYFGTLNWPSEEDHNIKLAIKKTGYDIKGELTFISGRHSGKRYSIKGKYSHGLLTFTYEPVDKASTSYGTGFFQRKEDGDLFQGRFSYISQKSSNIESIECELRAPSNLPPTTNATLVLRDRSNELHPTREVDGTSGVRVGEDRQDVLLGLPRQGEGRDPTG